MIDNIDNTLAWAKRVATMTSAMVLISDFSLEWSEDFTLDIRVWIIQYLSRNLNHTAPEHIEAYELAQRLIGERND